MLKLLGSICVLGGGLMFWLMALAEQRRTRTALGDLLAALRRMREEIRMARTPLPLLLEALGLGCTAFLPQSCNAIANATISFVCGIQLESFQRTAGCAAATTMCVGNLRLAVHFAMEYLYARRREDLRKMLVYLLIILAFIAGAVAGDQLIRLFGERAIWGSSAALMLCVFLWKAES